MKQTVWNIDNGKTYMQVTSSFEAAEKAARNLANNSGKTTYLTSVYPDGRQNTQTIKPQREKQSSGFGGFGSQSKGNSMGGGFSLGTGSFKVKPMKFGFGR